MKIIHIQKDLLTSLLVIKRKKIFIVSVLHDMMVIEVERKKMTVLVVIQVVRTKCLLMQRNTA